MRFTVFAIFVILMNLQSCKQRKSSSFLGLINSISDILNMKSAPAEAVAEICQLDQLYFYIGNAESMGEFRFNPAYPSTYENVVPQWEREDREAQLSYYEVIKSRLHAFLKQAALSDDILKETCWRSDVRPLIKKNGSVTVIALTDGPNVSNVDGAKVDKDTLVQSFRFEFFDADQPNVKTPKWEYGGQTFWSLSRNKVLEIQHVSDEIDDDAETFWSRIPKHAYREYLMPLAWDVADSHLVLELERRFLPKKEYWERSDKRENHFSQVHYFIKSHGAKFGESGEDALNIPRSSLVAANISSRSAGLLFDHHGTNWLSESANSFRYTTPLLSPHWFCKQQVMFKTFRDINSLTFL